MAHSTARTALIPAILCAPLCAVTLSGCLTPHVKPDPSPAVLQARANIGQKAVPCTPGGLETISPLELGFAFDDAAVTETDRKRLTTAVRWLSCNPGVEVVVSPDADNHGDGAHLKDLAQHRGQAVAEELRTLGATSAVIRLLPRGEADPVTTPHLLIAAQGRGW